MFQVIVQLYTVFCFPEYNYFNTYDLSTLLDVFKKDELVTSDTKKILFTLLRFLSCILGAFLQVWGLSAGYQPRPQVVDRGTTPRYGGQLRYI